jgi:hypothetical protein
MEYLVPLHSGRRGLVAEGAASHGLDYPVDHPDVPTGPVWPDPTDGPSHLSSPDASGADQIDAEHQATDLALGQPQRSFSRSFL